MFWTMAAPGGSKVLYSIRTFNLKKKNVNICDAKVPLFSSNMKR